MKLRIMIEVEGLLYWDGDRPEVAQFTLNPGKPPIYDLVLQQAFAQILFRHGGNPVPIKVTIEDVSA
jgi:hypothetical protein